MKNTKKFFDNSRLNRGYKKISNDKQADIHSIRQKCHHILPPIDIIEQYEELRPGTWEKLCDMASTEQANRHSIEILAIEKYSNAMKYGRIFALAFILLIAISATMLVIAGSYLLATIFVISAFFSVAIIAYFQPNRSNNKEFGNHRHNRSRPYRNNSNSAKRYQK